MNARRRGPPTHNITFALGISAIDMLSCALVAMLVMFLAFASVREGGGAAQGRAGMSLDMVASDPAALIRLRLCAISGCSRQTMLDLPLDNELLGDAPCDQQLRSSNSNFGTVISSCSAGGAHRLYLLPPQKIQLEGKLAYVDGIQGKSPAPNSTVDVTLTVISEGFNRTIKNNVPLCGSGAECPAVLILLQ